MASLSAQTVKTPRQVWEALAAAAPGTERAAILQQGENRALILNSGSFVIFTNGDLNEIGNTLQEKLSLIRVLQTQRLRTLSDGHVIMDGKGTFGGLSERSLRDEKLAANIQLSFGDLEGRTIEEFLQGSMKKKLEALVALRDDLSLDADGRVVITSDLSEIALTTAAREAMEEVIEVMALQDITAKLHIDNEPLRFIFIRAALIPIPLSHARDDNFVINIWTGDLQKPAFAVTPFGHIATLDIDSFNAVVGPGRQKMQEGRELFASLETRAQLKEREIMGVEDIFLFDALKQWGKYAEDKSRDLSNDYRYPHEWIGIWRTAQIALGYDKAGGGDAFDRRAGMIRLAQELQRSIIEEARAAGKHPYNINIFGALVQMNGGSINQPSDLRRFDEDFDFPTGTFVDMHMAAEEVMREAGYLPTRRLVSYLNGENAVDFMAARAQGTTENRSDFSI